MGYLVLHQAVAHSIMNGSYYQHVWVVMGPPAKAWLPHLFLLSFLPKPFICSQHFGFPFLTLSFIWHLPNLTASFFLLCSRKFTRPCCSNSLELMSGNLTKENPFFPNIFVNYYCHPSTFKLGKCSCCAKSIWLVTVPDQDNLFCILSVPI